MKNFKNFEALDWDMRSIVQHLINFKAPPLESLDYVAARNNPTLKNAVEEIASHSAIVRTMNVTTPVLPERVDHVEHYLIPTRDGHVNTRFYFPKTAKSELPIIVYFHGGGWVIADLNVYEASCRALCNVTEAIVASVAYRQAPEYKFPAAVNDAYDAAQFIIRNARSFGGATDRVAVAGESAGGNLATVACMMAKEQNAPMPRAQLLIYPVTDTSQSQGSYTENEDTQPLHSSMMPWFFNYYLEDKTQAKEPHVAPLLADNLGGLPPAIVITAQFDPLRDEGEQYAEKLRQAGVPVWTRRFDGVTHEFFGLAGSVSKAKEAVKFAADALKNIF
ncbi:MAG: alpha/beta hydrolase, partial [Limisphaerales bacterium]